MSLDSADTSPEARAVLVRLLRQMAPERKLEQVAALNRMVRGLALTGLRERHPDASEEELRLRLAALLLGPELAGKVYGWAPERGDY